MMALRRARCPLSRLATVRCFSATAQPAFNYEPVIQSTGPLPHKYRKLTSDYVSTVEFGGKKILQVEPEALRLLAATAMVDIAHLLRPGHLQQLRNILDDAEASDNDRFVALELLKNANVAAGKILPGCQDTGTAIVQGKRGQYVWTDGEDEAALSRGVFDTYTETNLRYSQVAPLDMFTEANTKSNLPAQIDLYAQPGNTYNFHFMAKGGGSANKSARSIAPLLICHSALATSPTLSVGGSRARPLTHPLCWWLSCAPAFLYQQTKALLNEKKLMEFFEEKIATLGTSGAPTAAHPPQPPSSQWP